MNTDGHGFLKKRGRRVLRIALTCAVMVAAVAILWPREREPVYQGKKLSEWIRGAGQTMEELGGRGERAEAVRQIGTNALPLLVRWIDCPAPPAASQVDYFVDELSGKLGRAWMHRKNERVDRARDALWAFDVLGSTAQPATAELQRLRQSSNSHAAGNAWYALYTIGARRPRSWINELMQAITNGLSVASNAPARGRTNGVSK